MLALLTLVAAYAVVRAVRAVVEPLLCLPRSNSDFVFF